MEIGDSVIKVRALKNSYWYKKFNKSYEFSNRCSNLGTVVKIDNNTIYVKHDTAIACYHVSELAIQQKLF